MMFRATLEPEFTKPRLCECLSCALLQSVPALAPGIAAHCSRCGTIIHKARRHPLEYSLALTVAALVLLVVLFTATLLSVETAGIKIQANLFSGPEELVQRGMTALAVVVVFVTAVAPFAKLLGTLYVLLGLRMADPPRHLRRIFVLVERLTPWSMVEVFVFGVMVAYVKLGDLVTIDVGTGLFALFGLTFIMVWADSALDRTAVWDAFDQALLLELEQRKPHVATVGPV